MFRKQRKVKRYHNIYRGSVTSSPFFKLGASAAALAVLIAAGWFLYEPVYQFVMGIGQEKEPVSTAEQPSEPESESDGFLSGLFGGGEESETETSQSQPEAVEAVQLHGVYMPESILLDSTQRSQFIQTCASNGINAIFFDLKNDKGYLTYQSSLAQAAELGSQSASAVDLSQVTAEMEAAGITSIGRIYAFKDPLAASAKLEAAVHYQGTEWAWLDNSAAMGGKAWLNPVNEYAQSYISDLAAEAVGKGVKQVILDCVQFPSGYSLEMADYGQELTEENKSAVLEDFIESVDTRVREAGGETAVYLSAPTLLSSSSGQYGSDPFQLTRCGVVLGVMPASFGNAYSSGELVLEAPALDPYATVQAALAACKDKLLSDEVTVLLQSYTSGTLSSLKNKTYTGEDVDSQIRAAQESGYESYLLYSPDGNYSIVFGE